MLKLTCNILEVENCFEDISMKIVLKIQNKPFLHILGVFLQQNFDKIQKYFFGNLKVTVSHVFLISILLKISKI
jgi:hypothetical protein